MRSPWIINSLAALLILAAAFALDRALQLGDFHGLVFRLYSLYGLAGLALINVVIAAMKRSWRLLLPGVVPAGVVALIIVLIPA